MLERILRAYFGEEFGYCEHYLPQDCCRTFPCQRDTVHFSKNHDLKLTVERPAGLPCIVQYRAFLPALVSSFELQIFNGRPDTAETFQSNALQAVEQYVRFVAKWVGHTPKQRRLMRNFGVLSPEAPTLVIRYEDLVARPMRELTSAISFFETASRVDRDRLRTIVQSIAGLTMANGEWVATENLGVKDRRRIEEFRFYDSEFFNQLQQSIAEALGPESWSVEFSSMSPAPLAFRLDHGGDHEEV